jgi:hypothetical protein
VLEQGSVRPSGPTYDVPGSVEQAGDTLPVARRQRAIDIVGNQLVLGFLDHVPEDEGSDARIGAAKESQALRDQPAGHAQGHRLEPSCVGEPPAERPGRKTLVRRRHRRLDRGETGISAGEQHVVVAAVATRNGSRCGITKDAPLII